MLQSWPEYVVGFGAQPDGRQWVGVMESGGGGGIVEEDLEWGAKGFEWAPWVAVLSRYIALQVWERDSLSTEMRG